MELCKNVIGQDKRDYKWGPCHRGVMEKEDYRIEKSYFEFYKNNLIKALPHFINFNVLHQLKAVCLRFHFLNLNSKGFQIPMEGS